MERVYVGTYAQGGGIFSMDMDRTGMLSVPTLFAPVLDAKYLIFHENLLYTIVRTENGSGLAAYAENQSCVAQCLYEAGSSCYIKVHKGIIYTCNYHEGTVNAIAVEKQQLRVVHTQKMGAGCHQILPMGLSSPYMLVPCLLDNKLVIVDTSLHIINEIPLPNGSGPRHAVCSQDGKLLYLACEKADTLLAFTVQGVDVVLKQSLDLLAGGAVQGTAAIRWLSPTVLGISIREVNKIALVEVGKNGQEAKNYPPLRLMGLYPAAGEHPRDMLPLFNQGLLLVAHRDSGTVVTVPYASSPAHMAGASSTSDNMTGATTAHGINISDTFSSEGIMQLGSVISRQYIPQAIALCTRNS